jgi:equilibrative nucleoside transporter 1/2/3
VNHSQSNFFLSPPLFVSLHFVIFNIGDYIGRDIASPTHLSWWNEGPNDPKLLLASIGRLIFVPLFLMCNVNGKASSLHPSIPFINSDIAYFVILLLFSISSGYLVNIVMMSATSVEHNRQLRVLIEEAKLVKGGAGDGTLEVDAAATVAQFCLVGGLFLGSFMSFGVQSIICGGCNPFYD